MKTAAVAAYRPRDAAGALALAGKVGYAEVVRAAAGGMRRNSYFVKMRGRGL
jgi:hypothetical protein